MRYLRREEWSASCHTEVHTDENSVNKHYAGLSHFFPPHNQLLSDSVTYFTDMVLISWSSKTPDLSAQFTYTIIYFNIINMIVFILECRYNLTSLLEPK